MRSRRPRLLLLLSLAFAATGLRAYDADLDPSFFAGIFGNDGVTPRSDSAIDLLPTTNGLVVVGSSEAATTTGRAIFLRRLGNNGGASGAAVTRDALLDSVTAADEAGGKIVVIGDTPTKNQDGAVDTGVVKLDAAFAFEGAFAGDGSTVLNFAGGDRDRALDVALDPLTQRTYVAVHVSNDGGNGDVVIAMLDPNGTLRSSVLAIDGIGRGSGALSLDAQGRVLFVGSEAGPTCGLRIRRFVTTSTLIAPDSSFNGIDGVFADRYTGTCEYPTGIGPDAEGRVLVTTFRIMAPGWRGTALRYAANGVPDPGWAADDSPFAVEGFTEQGDGRILLFGYISSTVGMVERRLANGAADGSFSSDNVSTEPFKFRSAGVPLDTVLADVEIVKGRIVLYGSARGADTDSDLALAAMVGSDIVFANSYE